MVMGMAFDPPPPSTILTISMLHIHTMQPQEGSIIVPLAADFTTANIPDNQLYDILTASLPLEIIGRTKLI
jgi:hypothetical protein